MMNYRSRKSIKPFMFTFVIIAMAIATFSVFNLFAPSDENINADQQTTTQFIGEPSPMPSSEGRSDSFDDFESYEEALASNLEAERHFEELVGVKAGDFVKIMTMSAEAKNPSMCNLFDNLCVAAGVAATSPIEVRANPAPIIEYLLSLSDNEMREVAEQVAKAKAIAGPKDPVASNDTGINI